MEKPITIKLSGSLAKKFGREHKRVVYKTKDAIKALCLTLDGFQKHLMNSHKNGITYAVFKGRKNISVDDFNFVNGEDEIRIVPVLMGSKNGGAFQTILGAVMVVAGIAISYFSAGSLAAFGGNLAMAGVAMMASGIVQMLSPQPKGLSDSSDADNKPSYAFGGAKNTTAQGYPVPLLYGRRLVGGAIISAGIYTEDEQ